MRGMEEVEIVPTGENVLCTVCRGEEPPCVPKWGGDSGPRGGARGGLLMSGAFLASSYGVYLAICVAFD